MHPLAYLFVTRGEKTLGAFGKKLVTRGFTGTVFGPPKMGRPGSEFGEKKKKVSTSNKGKVCGSIGSPLTLFLEMVACGGVQINSRHQDSKGKEKQQEEKKRVTKESKRNPGGY